MATSVTVKAAHRLTEAQQSYTALLTPTSYPRVVGDDGYVLTNMRRLELGPRAGERGWVPLKTYLIDDFEQPAPPPQLPGDCKIVFGPP